MDTIHSEEYKVLLAKLKKARRESKFTQAEIAQKLNKPQSFISKVESGERRLDIIELKRLAKLYGISVSSLLE